MTFFLLLLSIVLMFMAGTIFMVDLLSDVGRSRKPVHRAPTPFLRKWGVLA